jgi:dUTP pyrophosphatase
MPASAARRPPTTPKWPSITDKYVNFHRSNDPVEIHYTLIKDINDSEKELNILCELLKRYEIPIKFIRFNPINDLKISDNETKWLDTINENVPGLRVKTYSPPGREIGSSCGEFTKHYYHMEIETPEQLKEFEEWKAKHQIYEVKEEEIKPKTVYIETCRDNISLPDYANEGDAGMDVRAADDVSILPGETKVVPTGLIMAIPRGYEVQVRPRSGLSLKTPLRIANSPGTIDSGYRDELGIIVSNISPTLVYDKTTGVVSEINANENVFPKYTIEEKGNKFGTYQIKKDDRIAQIVLCKHETIKFEQVEKGIVKKIGSNRGGGYGHSGTK